MRLPDASMPMGCAVVGDRCFVTLSGTSEIREIALVPYLYNASFTVERPQALQILRRVLSLPEPRKEAGEARTALVMPWNNACIHAHALGDSHAHAMDASNDMRSWALLAIPACLAYQRAAR